MKNITYSNNVITASAPEFPFAQGIGQTMYEKMTEAENQIAQIDGVTGETETYAAVLERCVRTAIAMSARGVASDDVVTVCSGNHFDTCVPIIASFFLDAKVANLDPRLPRTQAAFLLKQVRPKMIFVGVDAVGLIESSLRTAEIAAEIVVFGENAGGHAKFSEFLVDAGRDSAFRPADVDDLAKTAVIVFSSGTTGLSKGICLNHKTLLSTKIRVASEYFQPNSVYLATSSPYWISYTTSLIKCTFGKSSRLIVPYISTEETWQLITKYKVNMMMMSSTAIATMCQNVRPEDADSSGLRVLRFGGSPCTSRTIATLRKLLPTTEIRNSYGLTEVGGPCADFWPANEDERKLALTKTSACGQPLPGFAFKVVDIETEERLGFNQAGEIRIRTEFQMNGYHNMDASDQWDRDGFLKTGDVGYFDEDYYIHITDRIKDMFKYQSWHISPVKLEHVLMSHPAVDSAIVVGVPHPVDNGHPVGIVTLKRTHVGVADADEIRKFVDEQVGNIYRLRGGVRIVEKLEKGPSDKSNRKHIKDLILTGKI